MDYDAAYEWLKVGMNNQHQLLMVTMSENTSLKVKVDQLQTEVDTLKEMLKEEQQKKEEKAAEPISETKEEQPRKKKFKPVVFPHRGRSQNATK